MSTSLSESSCHVAASPFVSFPCLHHIFLAPSFWFFSLCLCLVESGLVASPFTSFNFWTIIMIAFSCLLTCVVLQQPHTHIRSRRFDSSAPHIPPKAKLRLMIRLAGSHAHNSWLAGCRILKSKQKCSIALFPGRQAIKMLNSNIPRTASNTNAQ